MSSSSPPITINGIDVSEMSYKQVKELWVSGLTGTSYFEIQVTIAAAVIGLANYALYISRNSFAAQSMPPLQKPITQYISNLFFEFTAVILPMIFVTSSYVDSTSFLIFGIILFFIQIYFYQHDDFWKNPHLISSDRKSQLPKRKPFLDAYRSLTNIMTAICILAVDYVIYPRRYGKTETFGTGLMDVGVGSFLLNNAVVSRCLPQEPKSSFIHSLKSLSPLFLLGFIRYVSIQSVNYQEHVTEYGRHWNFFFTLFFVGLCYQLIYRFIYLILKKTKKTNISSRTGIYLSLLIGIIISVSHQSLLRAKLPFKIQSKFGLQEFGVISVSELILLDGFREQSGLVGFFLANREGIISVLGYTALYFFGNSIGVYLHETLIIDENLHDPISGEPIIKSARSLYLSDKIPQWIFIDVLLWGITLYFDSNVQRPSRRFCNMTYILWMLALNFPFLCFLQFLYAILPHNTDIGIFRAINNNALGFFLIANLGTGMINIFTQTIFEPPITAFFVVIIYVLSLILAISFLDRNDIILHKLSFPLKPSIPKKAE